MAKTQNSNINTAEQVAILLAAEYPDAKTELTHENEFQLAVAVMLSAQTTDKKVNQITPKVFLKYKNWGDLGKASLSDLQQEIYGVNFHLGKADRLIKAGQFVTSTFGGSLPSTIAELIKIPGIARKSANVIIQELWNRAEGIVVDTHVTRVSNRLGLTKNKEPVKIENDLMAKLPQKYWRNFSSALVLHGRYVCTAHKANCGTCVLNKICPSAFKI